MPFFRLFYPLESLTFDEYQTLLAMSFLEHQRANVISKIFAQKYAWKSFLPDSKEFYPFMRNIFIAGNVRELIYSS